MPIMTNETINDLLTQMAAAHNDLINAEARYRTARGSKFLEMAVPQNGEKKPSDEVIKARLDIDPELTTLRVSMDTYSANLSLLQYRFKALVAMTSAEGAVQA